MRKSTLAHSLVNLLMSIYKEEKTIYFVNYARGCNYAIFSVRFFLLFLQKWQEILYCYEIFIIYPDISLVHLKKKKLRYYLNLNMHAVCNHDLPCS